MSDEDIEIVARWKGKAGSFISNCYECGFLEKSGDNSGYIIHDWLQHNPWAASRPQRIEKARNAALKRWGGGVAQAITEDANKCREDATSIPLAHPSNALHDSPRTPLNQDQNLTTTSSPLKRKRRTKEEILDGYPEEVKFVVNTVRPKWPATQIGDGKEIDFDMSLAAENVEACLKTPGVTPELLIKCADKYLAEKKQYRKTLHFFFGKGIGETANWRPYARMIIHNDKANGNGTQPRLPEVGNQSPEESHRVAGVGR